jgi:hypothetical protein
MYWGGGDPYVRQIGMCVCRSQKGSVYVFVVLTCFLCDIVLTTCVFYCGWVVSTCACIWSSWPQIISQNWLPFIRADKYLFLYSLVCRTSIFVCSAMKRTVIHIRWRNLAWIWMMVLPHQIRNRLILRCVKSALIATFLGFIKLWLRARDCFFSDKAAPWGAGIVQLALWPTAGETTNLSGLESQ